MIAGLILTGCLSLAVMGSAQAAGRETITGFGDYTFGMTVTAVQALGHCITEPKTTAMCKFTDVREIWWSYPSQPIEVHLSFTRGHLDRISLTLHTSGDAADLWLAVRHAIVDAYSPKLVDLDVGETDDHGAMLVLKDAQGAEIRAGQQGDGIANRRTVTVFYTSAGATQSTSGF
jgi:hypothetical protein